MKGALTESSLGFLRKINIAQYVDSIISISSLW